MTSIKATPRVAARTPAKPASLAAGAKAMVAKTLAKGASFKSFDRFNVDKAKLPPAARKQYDRFEKESEMTFQGPLARRLKVDGQTVYMAAAYNWPYEVFRFVLYDAQGKELARGSGVKDNLKWGPFK